MTLGNILYAPINDHIQPTVVGLLHEAWRIPEFQTQPKIMVDLGLIMVLEAESLRLNLEMA